MTLELRMSCTIDVLLQRGIVKEFRRRATMQRSVSATDEIGEMLVLFGLAKFSTGKFLHTRNAGSPLEEAWPSTPLRKP